MRAFAVCVAYVAACGAPSATPSATDADTVLSVAALVPADGATTVALGIEVSATFTQDLDPTTINGDSFKVLKGDAPVAGSIAYDESTRTVTFKPTERLTRLSTYRAIIASGVRSRAGRELGTDVTWMFVTAEGGWSSPMSIGRTYVSTSSAAARAPDGSIVAAWLSIPIQTAVRAPSGTWSNGPTLMPSSTIVHSLDLALNASGDGFAIWCAGLEDYNAAAAHYVAGAWEAPQSVESDVSSQGRSGSTQVAVATNGDAFAVWMQDIGAPTKNVWAARYDHLTGWEAPLEIGTTSQLVRPAIAIDSGDVPMVAWADGDVHVSRYVNGQWELPQTIGAGTDAHLVADANNNVTVIWVDSDVHARRWNGTAWQTDTIISQPGGSALTPSVAVDAAGDVMVVWWQSVGSDAFTFEAWANRLSMSGGWGAPTLLASVLGAQTNQLALSSDPAGNAIAGWNACDASDACHLYAARYVDDSGWRSAELIGTDRAELEVVHGGPTPVAIWVSTSAQDARTVWTSTYE